MVARVIPFLIAFVLLFAGAVASSHGAPMAADIHPAQELVSGDDQRWDQAPAQADAESLADIPDLLLGPFAKPSSVAMLAGLQPHALADRAQPDLKGPLRPPCASRLLA